VTTVEVPLRSLENGNRRPRLIYKPGDLVTSTAGYPILYEILAVEREGLLRVRGLNWAPGYSGLVSAVEIRPVTHILLD